MGIGAGLSRVCMLIGVSCVVFLVTRRRKVKNKKISQKSKICKEKCQKSYKETAGSNMTQFNL